MLRHARGRLPAVRGDAGRLPVRDARLPAVIAMMAHTDKVGASHWPVPDLLHAFLEAGLTLERFAETGGAVPVVLAIRARQPQP